MRTRAWSLVPLSSSLVPLLSTACGATSTSASAVHCGPGTELIGDTCFPADAGVAGTDGTAPLPDAAIGDVTAPPDALDAGLGVTPVDWTNLRGAPLQTAPVGTFTGRLFGVTDDRVVLQSGAACTNSQVSTSICDYTWMDDHGAMTAKVLSQTNYAAACVSRDARYVALVDGSDVSTCNSASQLNGAAALFDLETGASLWGGPSGTMPAFASNEAFSALGDWFFAPVPVSGGIPCPAGQMFGFSVDPPLGTPMEVPLANTELSDGRWFAAEPASGGTALGLVDPKDPSSFAPLATGPFRGPLVMYARNGWLHVESTADAAGTMWQVTSYDLTGKQGAAKTYAGVSSQYPAAASGRWVLFCAGTQGTTASCTVHDATGQVTDATVQIVSSVTPALAGLADLLVYRPVGATSLVARDLVPGMERTTPIAASKPSLMVMAGESVVVAVTSSAQAWAISESSAIKLAESVESTWMLPPGGFLYDATATASGAEGIVLITRDVAGGGVALDVWDASAGALVTLTNRALYATGAGDDSCGQPSVVYAAGLPTERGLQPTKHIFFGELSATDPSHATLFLMPIDRSSPPRAVADTLAADCRAPLVSGSGKRVATWLHHGDAGGDAIAIGTL